MSDASGHQASLEERLRRVDSVTEAALAHLSLEALLDELLSRVRELLDVDTAAVLLIDDRRRELVATAAKGIEEEVEQSVRLPLGRGFAGRIAATGEPVVLPVVEHGNVLNPLLLQRGIRSLLGVPLIADGSVIGVMHVGTLAPRSFDEHDTHLLQVVADRVALAVRARRDESHRAIAETLQRSLLPDRMPPLDNLEIAARYMPAHGGMIGGDWYDVFSLPSDSIAIAIGDMTGRGIDAAIQMSRLRPALRALALIQHDPAMVLAMLNQHVLFFDPGTVGSLLYGIIDPRGVLTYASAGHMPPLLINDGDPPVFLEEPGEPILGADPLVRYRSRHVTLKPGSALLLYTDGLVERRDEPLEEGMERLRIAAAERDWITLEDLCSVVIPPDRQLEDDLAVLSVRFGPPSDAARLEMRLQAEPRELSRLRRSLRVWLESANLPEQDAYDVLLAVSEAVGNAIEHAYDPSGGFVHVIGVIRANDIEVVVRDEGRWRAPRGSNRGRGRTLMQALTDESALETGTDGTVVRLRKKRAGH